MALILKETNKFTFSLLKRLCRDWLEFIIDYKRLDADLNGVLAHSQGVPQLDGFIPGARHDLTVISGESNAQDVFGVTDEAAGRRAAEGKNNIFFF